MTTDVLLMKDNIASLRKRTMDYLRSIWWYIQNYWTNFLKLDDVSFIKSEAEDNKEHYHADDEAGSDGDDDYEVDFHHNAVNADRFNFRVDGHADDGNDEHNGGANDGNVAVGNGRNDREDDGYVFLDADLRQEIVNARDEGYSEESEFASDEEEDKRFYDEVLCLIAITTDFHGDSGYDFSDDDVDDVGD